MNAPNRWLPVVGGVMMNMALGMFYGMSVFMLPLEKEFGWTRAQTSWVTTIGLALIAVWYVIAGYIQDRRGPRPVAVVGGLLFSLGFFTASYTRSLAVFYLTAGVIAGTGSGFGAGSGVFGPLALSLIDSVGWRSTFQILSVIFLAMTMTGAYLLRNPPPGYSPSGWDPSMARGATRTGTDVQASAMVRMPTFWALWIAYGLGTTAGTMVISQLVPFARSSGHSAAVAAFALTVGAFGSASGRVLSGWMSDYAGRLNTLLFAVYYCYGTQLSVYASTSADFFGTKNVGFNYGLLLCAWGVAAILGPFLGGRVYVATGEYRYAFFVAAAMSIGAIATLALAHNPHTAGTEHLKLELEIEKLEVNLNSNLKS